MVSQADFCMALSYVASTNPRGIPGSRIHFLGSQASFSANLSKLATGEVRAFWLDPRTGESKPAGRLSNSGEQSFSTPEGWEDALLVLE